VTSLPNAVAAVYLARRDRGPATLSTAMNSNALNVAAGLLVPAVAVGLHATGPATLVAAWYLGLTVFALVCAYAARGLRREHGALIICAYVAFTGTVLATRYGSSAAIVAIALAAATGVPAVILLLRRAKRRGHAGHAIAATPPE
jgi:hypothetical protein